MRPVNVSGDAAWSKDFADQLSDRLPLIFTFVFALTTFLLLLLVTFRSLVIPIKAILLNLLLVKRVRSTPTHVAGQGAGESLLGSTSNGGVADLVAAVPLRDPVPALDGLPRLHPLSGARGLQQRHEHDDAVIPGTDLRRSGP